MSNQALHGVRVCDFTWAVAGPMMSKYLADYGAVVVKVENAKRPDVLRTLGPYKDGVADLDRSGYFAFYHSNKYSISLNLQNSKGVEVARRLISWADVVCENFTPGVMEKLGLDYEQIRKVKPDIIMLSSSGQGQTGPYARVPIAGNWLVSLSGFTWVTGWPDTAPTQPFGAYNDFIAPRYGAIAILAALRYKRRTGKGQYIDLSQLEAGLQFLGPLFMDYTVNGREGERRGNSCSYAAPHGVYHCREGKWCAIAVFNDQEWQAFCLVLGTPPWTKEARFKTIDDRKRNEEALNKLISEWTIHRTSDEVMTLMQKAGVAAGMVQNAKDLFEDPQLKYRNYYWEMEHRVIGSYAHLGQAAILSRTPAHARMPSPCLGEHTEHVCKQFLKISDKEFEELLSEGVFGFS